MFALYDDSLKSTCVVTQESDDICELKNIATYEEWQGNGYGTMLLQHIFSYYNPSFTELMFPRLPKPLQSKGFLNEKNNFSDK
jgi:GNAT superfamily N-acetyltransferase